MAFSATLMDHFLNPRHAGRLEAPDAVGSVGAPDRPPYMVLMAMLDQGTVRAIRFQTFGCGTAIACGSRLTELLVGRPLAEARGLTAAALIDALDGVPDDKRWCADVAIAALRDLLGNAAPGAGTGPTDRS